MQTGLIWKSFILIGVVLDVSLTAHAQWTRVGAGVSYKQANFSLSQGANNVLITYGGHLVDDSTIWTDRLLSRSILGEPAYGIRHAYAVIGPRTTTYVGLEIENSKIISHLYSLVANQSNKPRLIVILGHSSGSYVADEFFNQLFNKIYASPNDPVYSAISKRIVYYNLDGAITPKRKDSFYLRTLFASVNFVWSSKGALVSMNDGSMRSGPSYYPAGHGVKSVQVECPLANCLNGRCLHDALINEGPWDPYNFDIYRDYTMFSADGHEVQSAFITESDLLAAILNP